MKLDTSLAAPEGLDSIEAARRLARDGPNRLPDAGGRRWQRLAADAAREPMYLLLTGAAVLYLLLGEPREGAFLLGMVVLMLCLTLFQEGRTERALQALRDLSSPTALVWRDGQPRRLPASELVEGDMVELCEGDRVPADGLLLAAAGLQVDESLLTGESVPAGKIAAPQGSAPAPPGGADLPWVYSGTLVVQGHGLARISATGPRSEIGRIGTALGRIAPPAGRLQSETAALARRFALLGGTVSAVLVVLLVARGSDWLQALLAGIALSMSMLPEEFPVILTVFPAIGAWRLARRQVLTRRLALLLSNRQRGGAGAALRVANPIFWSIAGMALALLALALPVPQAASMLRVVPPSPAELGIAALTAALALAGLALHQRLRARIAPS